MITRHESQNWSNTDKAPQNYELCSHEFRNWLLLLDLPLQTFPLQAGGRATRCASLSSTIISAGATRPQCYQKQQVERCLSDPWMGSGLNCFWWSWRGHCCSLQSELGRPSMKISCVPSTRWENGWIQNTCRCQVACSWRAFCCADPPERWCVRENVN